MLPLAACAAPDPATAPPPPPATTPPLSLSVEIEDPSAHGVRLLVTADRAAAPTLRCTAPDEPAEDHVLSGLAATTQTLALHGLLADTDHTCTVTAGDGTWEGVFRTAAEDPAVPATSLVVDRGDAEPGYTLLDTWVNPGSPTGHPLLVVDPEGRVRWSWALDEPASHDVDARWEPAAGAFLVGGGSGYAPRYVALDGTTGWTAPGPEGSGHYHHHAERLPDGQVLALATEDDAWEGVTFNGVQVEVRDPATDAVTWAWHGHDALAAGALPAPTGADADPWHANAVQLVDDALGPAAWISFAKLDRILRVDRATGAVTTTIGAGGDLRLVDADGAPLGDDGWFYGQHHPTLDPAAGTLLVYDNGVGRPGERIYSRVVELAVDLEAGTATPLWQWAEPGWYEPRYGDADRLPGGHVLVAMGHCACVAPVLGHRSAVVEVDPATDEVVWRLELGADEDGLYRAERVDGCTLFANRRYCAERG